MKAVVGTTGPAILSACMFFCHRGQAVRSLVPLLRQSVYSRLAGSEDTNDADRLAGDLALRVVTTRQAAEKPAASTNTPSRFETEVLIQEENVEGLAQLNATWVEKAMAHTPHR